MNLRKRIVVGLVLASNLVTGCLTGKPGNEEKALSLSLFTLAREDAISRVGEWQEAAGGIENVIPAGALPQDVLASKDGVGVSLALLNGLDASDVKIECNAGITVGSVAGVVFRAAEKDGVVTSMYYFSLATTGVSLWRYQDKRWSLVTRMGGIVPEQTPCLLAVRAKGEEVQVTYNKTKLQPFRDTSAAGGTRVGICAREGYSRFYSFEAHKL